MNTSLMKRFAFAALLPLALTASLSAAEVRGAWTAEADEMDRERGRIQMQMTRKHSNHGNTMQVAAFTGLAAAQIYSATQVPVNFSLRREAGTISYEGTFKGGFGAGQFSFAANPAYIDTLRALGVTTEPARQRHRESTIEERLLQLALNDVSTDFIRSMRAEGYNVSLNDYLKFRIFRVTPELVRELRTLGFNDIPAGELVSSQIHKVTPQYIREMNAAGFANLSLKDLQSTRIHQVTPEFAREMRQLGYELALKDLTSFRIHRVTPEFIRELGQLGYDKVPAKQLVSMRIHKVTPQFIRDLKAAGYANVPVDKLISMKIHGIDADFARKMNSM